jgi:hypothetical protein
VSLIDHRGLAWQYTLIYLVIILVYISPRPAPDEASSRPGMKLTLHYVISLFSEVTS